MINEFDLHQGGDESEQNLFSPYSDTHGKDLEFNDSYMEDPRWRVPEYLRFLPNELKGNVMYLVHAVLENITVDNQESRKVHREAESVLGQAAAKRYLREQLQFARRILH